MPAEGEETVRVAVVTSEGDRMRWVELPGQEPPRVHVHGLGASSPAYFTESAVNPLPAGRRSLLVDLPVHGIGDRPTGFRHTLEDHADALAAALTSAGVTGGEVVGHGMGGLVAIVLVARHPHLVSRLVLVDANLDPVPAVTVSGGSGHIASFTEEEFLSGPDPGLRVPPAGRGGGLVDPATTSPPCRLRPGPRAPGPKPRASGPFWVLVVGG